MYIQGNSRQADSTGFVMNGILLHIRRKCTLQCGFTNCLHCPKNDSLYTAENGSQPDSQTDRQHSANRQTSLQSLQTNSSGKTGRETDSLWQIQPEQRQTIQKRPTTSRYRHRVKDRWVTHTDRQQRVCHQLEYDVFVLQSYWVENSDLENLIQLQIEVAPGKMLYRNTPVLSDSNTNLRRTREECPLQVFCMLWRMWWIKT